MSNETIAEQGYLAAATGSDLFACPYDFGSQTAIEWMSGYWIWTLEQQHQDDERG